MDFKILDHLQNGKMLESQRLQLRRLKSGDVSSKYLSWLQNPEINRFLETQLPPQPLESIQSFVEAHAKDPFNYLLGIFLKTSAEHIGNIKMGPINTEHFFTEISFFIGETNYWGKGFATEAISRVVRFAFQDLKLHKIQAGANEKNVGSMKALQNCGFVQEGIFSKQFRFNDEWQDHLIFGIINPHFN